MVESVDFESSSQQIVNSGKQRFKVSKVPEERFNTLSHFVGGLISIIGLIFLLVKSQGDGSKIVISIIYSTSNFLLFFASAKCHSKKLYADHIFFWSTIDQIAMIAGTYTPIVLFYLDGAWKIGLLVAQWGFALIGIIMKIFVPKTPRWFTASIYLIQGWMLIPALGQLLQMVSNFHILMIIAGGLFYSIGATFYVTDKPKLFPGKFGAHELWHIFVILGAMSFYLVVFQSI